MENMFLKLHGVKSHVCEITRALSELLKLQGLDLFDY